MSSGGSKDICKALDPDDNDMRFTAVVTHPNGTKGTFTSKYRLKGRANVRRNRNGHFSGHPYAGNDLVNISVINLVNTSVNNLVKKSVSSLVSLIISPPHHHLQH